MSYAHQWNLLLDGSDTNALEPELVANIRLAIIDSDIVYHTLLSPSISGDTLRHQLPSLCSHIDVAIGRLDTNNMANSEYPADATVSNPSDLMNRPTIPVTAAYLLAEQALRLLDLVGIAEPSPRVELRGLSERFRRRKRYEENRLSRGQPASSPS